MYKLVVSKNYRYFILEKIDTKEKILETTDVHIINRCLNDDIVDIENNRLILRERSKNIHKKIVGILHTNSKIKYGINKKGNSCYLFTPFSNKYPNFLVFSSLKDYFNNYYVIIEFLEWNNTTKYPRGNLIKIIGPLGNLDMDIEALENHYNIKIDDMPSPNTINNFLSGVGGHLKLNNN
jgi:exoribonuclease R